MSQPKVTHPNACITVIAFFEVSSAICFHDEEQKLVAKRYHQVPVLVAP